MVDMEAIIRLKVWDKNKKTMSGSFTFADVHAYDGETRTIGFTTDNGETVVIGNNLGYSSDTEPSEFQKGLVFIRYTGLKDKHGTGVYEFDWLQENDGRMYFIVWADDEARFELENMEDHSLRHIKDVGAMKIVGNEYEKALLY